MGQQLGCWGQETIASGPRWRQWSGAAVHFEHSTVRVWASPGLGSRAAAGRYDCRQTPRLATRENWWIAGILFCDGGEEKDRTDLGDRGAMGIDW